MKKKIDDFGGISKLTQKMEKLRSQTEHKNVYDNMIIYFNNLYTQDFDVAGYAVEYKQYSLDTISFLKGFNETRNDETNAFLIDLIQFKLDSVANVVKIG